jgi:mycothiol system anti-sigma-R factor
LSGTSCEEVLAEVELYIDGELEKGRALHLADHLATCSPCLRRAEFRAKLKEIVRRKCHTETPEHLVVQIRTIIRSNRDDLPR